jgi:putative restriction endonuclease
MIQRMARRFGWSQEELLVAFRLYCRTPFGKLHQHNPEIIELARLMGRTASAVGMKACNFASLDPVQRARDITALGNVSRADRQLWEAFEENPEAVAAEAEAAYARLSGQEVVATEAPELGLIEEFRLPAGPTEAERVVRTRRVQAFFRAAVLASYEYRCALSEIAVPELLNASHIIPWQADVARRADPRNGLALNALYDRAFDRGLITFDEALRLVVSKRLKEEPMAEMQRGCFGVMEGRKLRLPQRFGVDEGALAWHRERVFGG